MVYTLIASNGQSYDLPKKTMKVVEEMDRVSKIDTIMNLSIREKFKKLFDFIVGLVGRDAAVEILGSDDINDVDLSEVTITFKKIIEAYDKPVNDYKSEKSRSVFDDVPVDKLVKVAEAADKIINMPIGKND